MGIDYGHGLTNINHETGIRYGVISQNTVCQAWSETSEPDYGEPTCPKCGAEFPNAEDIEECGVCGENMDAWAENLDPRGYIVDEGEYKATDCLDSDIMILESPFYTYAPFCSPCVPGAGNLDGADKPHVELFPLVQSTGITLWRSVVDGRVECIGGTYLDALDAANDAIAATADVKAYAFGHDWFYDTETGTAPYPVYGVVSERECFPDSWYGR